MKHSLTQVITHTVTETEEGIVVTAHLRVINSVFISDTAVHLSKIARERLIATAKEDATKYMIRDIFERGVKWKLVSLFNWIAYNTNNASLDFPRSCIEDIRKTLEGNVEGDWPL